MPYYPGLRKLGARRKFVAQELISLRKDLADQIPIKCTDGELLLATWNLRDFGGKRLNPQPRLPESLYYIAEIISHFDIVALQEVNRDMTEFNEMMRILGPDFDFIATDTAESDGGNDERMAFVYDKRKVRFRGIAGEVVLPKKDQIMKEAQFVRTPFVVSFQVGWLKIDLCTVHIYYGADSGEKLGRRVEEIKKVGEFFVKRSKKEKANTIILGDFNIVKAGHNTMEALLSTGFRVPEAIQHIPTNVNETKHYDQIAYYSPDKLVRFSPSKNAGKYKFFDVVFEREDEYKELYNVKSGNDNVDFQKWRTWQMSDHFLLWTRLMTDFTDEYLAKI